MARTTTSTPARAPAEMIHAWATNLRDVAPLAGPIQALLRSAAAVDPEAAALYQEVEAGRSRRMAHNAAHLARTGRLRPGMTPEKARDVMLLLTEAYERLVMQSGWTVEELGEFVERGLVAHLLDDAGPS
jgi:hypothetical protein